MADSYIQMPADGSGKKLRAQSRTVGADTVHESYVINTDQTTGNTARVLNVTPSASDYGLVTRPVPVARTQRTLYLAAFATAATADTQMTISSVLGFATATTGTSITITTGKTYRIQQIYAGMRLSSAAAHYATVRVRVNTGGASTVTSPIAANILLPAPAALANAGSVAALDIPDGLDIPAGAGIGVSVSTSLTGTFVDVCIIGYEY